MNLSRLVVVLLVSLAACQRSETPTGAESTPNAPAALAEWQVKLAKYEKLIKPGLSEAEVVQLIGEPFHAVGVVGSRGGNRWEYDLGESRKFRVIFDQNNRVARAELQSIQVQR
jgi:hypothetical protein